jgi:hypothetical protein
MPVAVRIYPSVRMGNWGGVCQAVACANRRFPAEKLGNPRTLAMDTTHRWRCVRFRRMSISQKLREIPPRQRADFTIRLSRRSFFNYHAVGQTFPFTAKNVSRLAGMKRWPRPTRCRRPFPGRESRRQPETNRCRFDLLHQLLLHPAGAAQVLLDSLTGQPVLCRMALLQVSIPKRGRTLGD